MTDDPLKNVIYISVPEELATEIGDFRVDPSILLPVETTAGPERWEAEELTWEEIISGMLKILAYDPENENVHYYREFVKAVRPEVVNELTETAILKARNRNFDLAEEIFLALRGLTPEEPKTHLNLALLFEERAEAYEKMGNEELKQRYLDRAFETYTLLLRSEELPADTFFNAGHFFLKVRNFARAKELFERFIEESDEQEKVGEARRILEKLEGQNLLDTLFKEAYDFIRLGEEEKGIERAKRFLEEHPGVWNAWFLLGWAHRRLRNYEQGREAFLKALELEESEPDLYNELAICEMELGMFAESRRRLEKALRLEPENTKIMSNLGILSLKEGKEEEAKGFFASVLDLAPEDEIARKYLEHLG
ncbi:MAG: tetratricopeptide repeat protein [Alkalispirochaetaceae bacterium]